MGYERDGLGMLNIATETFYHFPLPQKLIKWTGDNAINYILEVDNELWLASRFTGIFIFNRKTEEYRKLDTKFIDPRITFLLPETNSKIWIATKNGLYNYNRATGEIISYFHQDCNQYSLTNNSISCLLIDHQGILWTGSLQGGVNYTINQKGFRTFKNELCKNIHLSQQSVSAIYTDSRNNLWIGYFDNGIDIINRKNFSKKFYYDIPVANNSMTTGTIFCIFEDSKGRIWIGCYANGLFMYNPVSGRFSNYKNIPSDLNSISGNDVRSICEDKEHQLWLAVHGKGIVRFNPETGKCERISFPQNNFGLSPANNWVYKVYFDLGNNLWVTSVAGVTLSQNLGKSFENYHHNQKNLNSESLDVIWTLYDDGNLLWMGSNMGLSIFDKKQKVFTRVLTKKEGLPTDAVAGILADNKKQLWISTFSGLVRMNPTNYNDLKVFTKTDGLQGDQFFANACCRDASGEMFFGGLNGYSSFFADSIKEDKFIPPVEITDFKLFNKSENIADSKILPLNISETKEIVLKYSQNVITFNFVALNYAEPEKNQYAYMLEGFEKNWNISVNKREATYTNLSPGTYIFWVKASNNDGVWNEKGKSIIIRVLPPFWLSIWAFIVYALIVVLSLLLYKRNIQNREELKRKLALEHMEAEKQIEMNNIRLQFFTNISHEFRTSLSLIIGPAEKMINENDNFTDPQKQQVSLIRHNAQRLLRLINQLLDLRTIEAGNTKLYPSPGELIGFCKDIAKSFEYLAEQKHINFVVKSETEALFAWFDADKVEKIVYNLLSNAFKFTDDGGTILFNTSIDPDIQEPAFRIEVSDNGIGIPEENISKVFERFYQVNSSAKNIKGGTGIGLSLVKELVDMHKGKIDVKSKFRQQQTGEKDSGTTFIVSLPLDIREYQEETKPEGESGLIEKFDGPGRKDAIKPTLPLVLVVEDNSDLRLFVCSILKPNYRLIEAENGITGLKAAFDQNPDIIISDIMMPGMQGTVLCKTLKADERTSHIPIILLTALSSVENKIEGFELGADDYITKPFNSEILTTRIANLIENRSRIRSQFKKHVLVEPKDISITSIDEKFINRAIETVERHMADSMFDVDVFTKEMNVSRTLLHTKLKAITDLSATEFIKTLRLKRALKLLKEGQLSVSEVSIMVGFNSRNYFTKCFTELFGVSPTEYLKV
jgi:signal transduction histidine kinase/ligand-binding sensor domain-containing protein/DNA-binding response OmpR family regulator